jgi:hypothetical protein
MPIGRTAKGTNCNELSVLVMSDTYITTGMPM